jgi:hypothetical protein
VTQRTSDIIDVAIRVAREFGFPIVVLAAVMWCFRESAAVLHSTVLVPVVESHTVFIRQTSETLKTLGDTQGRQAETLQEIAAGQREIQHSIGRIGAGEGAR